MRNSAILLPLVIAVIGLPGCTRSADSLCDLPANRHFWQGLKVTWTADLVEFNTPPHGGGLYFRDWTCGNTIRLLLYHGVYQPRADERSYTAMAKFRIAGQIVYKDGDVWLKPDKMQRLEPWLTGEAAIRRIAQEYKSMWSRFDRKPPD